MSLVLTLLLILSVTTYNDAGRNNDASTSANAPTASDRPRTGPDSSSPRVRIRPHRFGGATAVRRAILISRGNIGVATGRLACNGCTTRLALIVRGGSRGSLSFVTGSVNCDYGSVGNCVIPRNCLGYSITTNGGTGSAVSVNCSALVLCNVCRVTSVRVNFSVDSSSCGRACANPQAVRAATTRNCSCRAPYCERDVTDGRSRTRCSCSMPCFSSSMTCRRGNLVVTSRTIVRGRSNRRVLLLRIIGAASRVINMSAAGVSVGNLHIYSSA